MNVLYGSARGLTADGDQLWSQAPARNAAGRRRLRRGPGRGRLRRRRLRRPRHRRARRRCSVTTNRPASSRSSAVGPMASTASGSVALDRSLTGASPDPTAIWFGFALAAADIDGDGYADLAVGTPGGGQSAGDVSVFYGSSPGYRGTRASRGVRTVRASPTSRGDDRFGELSPSATSTPMAMTTSPSPHTPRTRRRRAARRPGCGPLWGAGAVNDPATDRSTASPPPAASSGTRIAGRARPSLNQDGELGRSLAMGDFDQMGQLTLPLRLGDGGGSRHRARTADRAASSSTGDPASGRRQPRLPGIDEAGDVFGGHLAAADLGRSSATTWRSGSPARTTSGGGCSSTARPPACRPSMRRRCRRIDRACRAGRAAGLSSEPRSHADAHRRGSTRRARGRSSPVMAHDAFDP